MPYEIRGKCVHKVGDDTPLKCHDTEEQARAHLAALNMNVEESQQLWLEARIKPNKAEGFEGREWEVTIIGARSQADVVTVNGREYLRTLNDRLYSIDAIRESTPQWDGVGVYDNHQPQDEFIRTQGMRSVLKEMIGVLSNPVWESSPLPELKAIFKVAEDLAAKKLKNFWDAGILGKIGLSINTFPIVGQGEVFEGQRLPTIEGFKKILSVDLVAEPAAGGGFNRLIAANVQQEQTVMDEEKLNELIDARVKAALAELAPAAEQPETESEEQAAPGKTGTGEAPAEAAEQAAPNNDAAEQAAQEARLARCELMLERRLNAAKLPDAFRKIVEGQFAGQVFEEKALDAAIKRVKEAQTTADASGRVTGNGQSRQQVEAGLSGPEKFQVEFMRLMMGNQEFFNLEHNQESFVLERVREASAYKSWVNAGKPKAGGYRRISNLIYDVLGGDPLMDDIRATEASTLATVTKNTVNIMIAADYSQQERWYEQLVNIEEVDTIDDSTLARLFGVNTLSVVDRGGAYTELPLADEEETAAFVKRGNYVGVPIEDLMRDKISYFRSLPRRLSNTWYNTLSSQTSAVFTVNSATGPVLTTSGALFNATATSSAGGHANLSTTALNWTSYDAAVTAMISQTDQPLGAGRKLTELQMGLNLLVPVNLRAAAYQIRNTENQPGTGNFVANPYGPGGNQPNVILVPDWTDTNNWAVAGDRGRFPAIWHIFPRGGRTPQLFTADSDVAGAMFTNDELRFKIRMMTYEFSSTYRCSPVADFRPLHKGNVA